MAPLHRQISKRPIQIILFLLGIFCISLLAIQPFTLNQMPETADGLLHLYRTAVVDYSLKVENPIWSRYTTGIAYGYGAPLFNYFPPLSYYPGSWLHTLGLTFVQSWLAMMMLYTMISAIGMFLLGRIWTQSNVGGWVTALAYIYAPYFLFDSVARGTSSEMSALAVLPFVFYGLTRLAFYGRRVDYLFAVAAYALFIPMHTLLTLHGTLVLGVYCLFLLATSHERRLTFLRLILAGGVALMITAFFWLPAIVETDAVKIRLIAEQLDQIDVTQHLRPLGEILALPHTADPTRLGQPIPITLSVVQLILSAFGLIIAWNDHNPLFRNLLLTLWLIVLALIFMNTPTSRWLWENLPLIGFTQFPWRILGMASLLLALMTGISIWLSWMIIPTGWAKTAVFSVLTLIVVSYSIPWTYSLYLGDIELNDIRDVQQFERDTGQLTVSSYSEYLPVSTDESQLDPNRLIDRFENRDVIPRLLESENLEIVSAEWHPTSANLRLKSAQPQSLIFDWLYWSGWTAELDGKSIDVKPSSPVGLVAVDVPEGEFDLAISLQPTSIQSLSIVVSVLGIVGVMVGAMLWKFIAGFSNLHRFELDPEIRIYVIVVAIGLGVFLFKAVVLDHTDTQFKTARFGDLASENNEIVPLANFGDQIDLIDADVVKSENEALEVPITLYWKLHEGVIDKEYSSIVRFLDPQGIVIAESDSFQPGGLATSNWLPDAYVADTIMLEIPTFIPSLAGGYQYTLEASLFDVETLQELSVMNADGNPERVGYVFDTLDVRQIDPYQKSRRTQPSDYFDVGNDRVGLYQDMPITELPESVMVGDEIEFSWTWQSLTASAYDNRDDLYGELIWVDVNEENQQLYRSQIMPLVVGYPNYLWNRKEVVTGYHRLIVPADIPAGEYSMGVQVVDADGYTLSDVYLFDQSMTIDVPERVFKRPMLGHNLTVFWDNRIALRGFRLDATGVIHLAWQTYQLQNQNLKLFVHVLNGDDVMVAQSDTVPVDWTRPITGWTPNEYVTTTHHFDLPSGEYRIRVGWYDPVSGDNITVQGDDSIILDELLIVD